MMHLFSRETANNVWFHAAGAFRHGERTYEQTSRVGISGDTQQEFYPDGLKQ
jgi:hypothetical protein